MPRWEYVRISLTTKSSRATVIKHYSATTAADALTASEPEAFDLVHHHLDELGSEGWELAGVETHQTWSMYWLKRPAD